MDVHFIPIAWNSILNSKGNALLLLQYYMEDSSAAMQPFFTINVGTITRDDKMVPLLST